MRVSQAIALQLMVMLLCCWSHISTAAPEFPKLTGRVVDQAGLLSAADEQAISAKLAQHEQATTNQVVVVTLKTLQGYDIADYGYQLGRHWGIGQKDKNNGVLLIIAPNERQLRIEVGYGLEGVLPDATAKIIIDNIIVPRFKNKQFAQGIEDGVDAILGAIGGTFNADEVSPHQQSDSSGVGYALVFFVAYIFGGMLSAFGTVVSMAVVFGIVLVGVYLLLNSIWFAVFCAVIAVLFYLVSKNSAGTSSGGGWGGSGGGGGFSGGGGSFGGGGASGGW